MTIDSARAPHGSGAGFCRDERGAILVLGVFMCACMVGGLWYLAGIGDAIIYRERMQEGADAVAFSGAVLHARGMNIIVVLNLLMAVILAIRVVLKAIQAAAFLLGLLLSAIPFGGIAAAGAFKLAELMNIPINATRQPINQTIRALSKVQTALKHIVPPAALAGSYQIGEHYRPIVRHSAAGNPRTIAAGLPITNDTESKLCRKAGEAVGSVLGSIIPFPGMPGVSDFIGKAVQMGGMYFCEIGPGGMAPDFSSEINSNANRGCDGEKQELNNDVRAKHAQWRQACDRYRCDSGGQLTQAQIDELSRLQSQTDAAQRRADDWEEDECRRRKRRELNQQMQQQMQHMNQAQNANGQGLLPKKMVAGWKNGVDAGQVVAIATGSFDSLRKGATGVKAGAWRTPITIEPPVEAQLSIAQAEFFFDCRGRWENDDCNGKPADSNALWRLRWRARLRRYSEPFTTGEGLEDLVNALGGARAFFRVMRNPPTLDSLTVEGAALVAEMGRIARDRDFIIH